MNKFVVILLVVSISLLCSCLKDDSPKVEYYVGAAVVKNMTSGKPIVEVLNDVILNVPGLSGENLESGDLLWAKMFIEDDKQTNKDTIFVSAVTYRQIGKSLAIPVAETASEYACAINRALMWRNHAGNFWVFEFEQSAPEEQTFDYEMQFGVEDGDSYPTVYLRSRKTNTVNGSAKQVVTNFGFDLTPLIEVYANEKTNTLTFRVKYLTGFDAQGEEMFTSFQQNPVSVKVEKAEKIEPATENFQ